MTGGVKTQLVQDRATETAFAPTATIPRSTVQAAIQYVYDFFAALVPSVGAAPKDASYLVGASDATLTAERVVTDTATVAWDLATAGQAKANVPDDAVTDAKLRNSGALSVIGRAANSSGDPADISATAGSGGVLRESGSALGFGQVATGGIADNAVTDAKLRDSAATSVIGRSAGTSGDPADIAAAADDTLLRRVSGALSWGALTLGMAAANLWTFAKLQQISTARFLGRNTAGTGDIEELTATTATAMLNAFTGDSGSGGVKGLVPAPAAGDAAASRFLKADATWATPTASVGDGSVQAKHLSTTFPAFGFDAALNLGLAASVAANALTIAIKGADGNDPSATNPVLIPFRSPTAATGTPVIRSLTAALSLTVSSGSTLGATSGQAFRLWVVIFDDGGTLRLGVINCSTASAIHPLPEYLASSTAEGGAGGADSAGVIYTGSAVTTKAYRIVGYLEWASGLTTAGTWDAAPTIVQLFGPGVKRPGEIVQTVVAVDSAYATGSTTVPFDDTIPQNTEGVQFMSQAITPAAAANLLEIEHKGTYTNSNAAGSFVLALFKDSEANALAAMFDGREAVANRACLMSLTHTRVAGGTSESTFKVRCGSASAGTHAFNGVTGRLFGGSMASYLKITERMG